MTNVNTTSMCAATCTVDLNVAWFGSNKNVATQVVFDQVYALNIKQLIHEEAQKLLQHALMPFFPHMPHYASVRVFWGHTGLELTQSPDCWSDARENLLASHCSSDCNMATSSLSSSLLSSSSGDLMPRVAAAWTLLTDLIHSAAAIAVNAASLPTLKHQDNTTDKTADLKKIVVPTLYVTRYSDTELVRGLVMTGQWCFFVASQPNERTDKLKEHISNDRKLMLFLARCRSPAAAQLATPALLDDKEFVLALFKICGSNLSVVSPRLRGDTDVVKAAIDACACNSAHGYRRVLAYVPRDAQCDRSLVLAAVNKYGTDLEFARDDFKADRSVVTAAVQNDGLALAYANDVLKDDVAVVSKAVLQSPDALLHASPRIQSDCAFVAKHVQCFQYASASVRSNKHAVIQVVRKCGQQLAHAADHLRSDRDVVVAALCNSGLALQFVNEPLRSNRALVLQTVKRWPDAYQFVHESLKICPEVVRAAWPYFSNLNVANFPPALRHNLMQDRSFVLKFVSSSGHLFASALQYAADNLRNDRQVVLAAIKHNPGALEFASEALRDDRSLVLAAGSLQHASVRLRGDKQLLLEVVKRCKERCKLDLTLMYAAEELLQTGTLL